MSSASDALQRLADAKPDVMVVDLGMPQMDGFEFIGRIRASTDADIRDIPAAALTAFAQIGGSHEGARPWFRNASREACRPRRTGCPRLRHSSAVDQAVVRSQQSASASCHRKHSRGPAAAGLLASTRARMRPLLNCNASMSESNTTDVKSENTTDTLAAEPIIIQAGTEGLVKGVKRLG